MKRVVPENIAKCMSEENGNNPSSNALANVLNQLNLPTLAMVMLMGRGNWLATKSTGDLNYHEIQRAATEVHDLYPRLMEALRNQNAMMGTQTRELENQSAMPKSQDHALQILQANQRRLFGAGTTSKPRTHQGGDFPWATGSYMSIPKIRISIKTLLPKRLIIGG